MKCVFLFTFIRGYNAIIHIFWIKCLKGHFFLSCFFTFWVWNLLVLPNLWEAKLLLYLNFLFWNVLHIYCFNCFKSVVNWITSSVGLKMAFKCFFNSKNRNVWFWGIFEKRKKKNKETFEKIALLDKNRPNEPVWHVLLLCLCNVTLQGTVDSFFFP